MDTTDRTPRHGNLIVCLDCLSERVHTARGLCRACYTRRRDAGSLEERPPIGHRRKKCSRCDRIAVGRELCDKHYEGHRRRAIAYGRWNVDEKIDASAAADHVRALRTAGMPHSLIISATHSSPRTISGLLNGTITTITQSANERIRQAPIPKVWPLEAPDQVLVDATGTVRRLQALVAMGWPNTELAPRLGVSTQALHPVVLGRHRRVQARRAREVRDLYNKLSMTSGGCNRAIGTARKHQWAPPLAWDDESIDSPSATPDLGDRRTPTAEDRLAEFEWLIDDGAQPEDAARRLGVQLSTVRTWKAGKHAA